MALTGAQILHVGVGNSKLAQRSAVELISAYANSRRRRGYPDRHRCGYGVFAIMPFRDPIDKRSSARLFRDRDYAKAQANAGSEPRDPFWWSAVLATRAAFAARPGAKLISVPLGGGSLSVSADGRWRASTPLPDDVAVQLDLYLPYCLSHPRGLAVAHIGQSLDGRIATENGDSRWITGEADLLHCHRMRELPDAVLVGARTLRAAHPQLPVRPSAGDKPYPVVLAPWLS